MFVFVISMDGAPLMPTSNVKKVRKLLRSGRARIYRHDPFTIRLLYESEKNVQPIELTMDTGYQHIGLSVKSEKHEYVSEERMLLSDEKQRHENQRREYRRPRRNRKRYRAPRFDNRKRPEGWLAPSLKNKADRHVDLYKRYAAVCPVKEVYLEMGSFDTQALAAAEKGHPFPEGTDYQRGPRYLKDTLRDAVFARDGHKCCFCGRGLAKGAILHVHHVGFWMGDRSNRMDNLATACDRCHIPSNHKKGGKLWGIEPKMGTLKEAAFMNTVRYYIYGQIRSFGTSVHMTYGTVTKHERRIRKIEKTHANDAYCIGAFHPKHRTPTRCYQKRRRNNRILEKFYDAKYVDIRDGKVKKAAQLGTNRTNRREPRMSDKNERIFRGEKKSKGRRSIRKRRYPVQPGTIVLYGKKKHISKGVQNYGNYTTLEGHPAVKTIDLKMLRQPSGWTESASAPPKS